MSSNNTREVTIKIIGQTDDFVRKMGPAGEVLREFGVELLGVYETMEKVAQRAGGAFQKMGAGLTASVAGFVAQAGRWEQSFADVAKTMQGSRAEIAQVGIDIRGLSREIPVSAGELARLGSIAGQLGIRADDVSKFVDVAAKLGVATELSSAQAITSLSRLINITGEARANLENLSSSLVHLGNVSNTSEGPILDFSMRIAGTASVAGVASQEVLGIASAFTAAGIEAEAGGTAVQKLFLDMSSAARTGSSQLTTYARVLGLTREQTKALIETDPAEAFSKFVEALQRAGAGAEDIFTQLGLVDVRFKRAFLSVAGSTESVRKAIDNANQGFEDNNALTKEAETRFETLFQETVRFKNVLADIPRSLGAPLLKPLSGLVRFAGNAIDLFNQLPEAVKGTIGVMTALGAVALTAGGTLAKLAFTLWNLNGISKLTLMLKGFVSNMRLAGINSAALNDELTRGQWRMARMHMHWDRLSSSVRGYGVTMKSVAAQVGVDEMSRMRGMGLGVRDIRRGYVGQRVAEFADDRRNRFSFAARGAARVINSGFGDGAVPIPVGRTQSLADTAKATQQLRGLRLQAFRAVGSIRMLGEMGASTMRLLADGAMVAGKAIGRFLLFNPIGWILLGTMVLPMVIKRFQEMRNVGKDAVDSVNESAAKLAETLRFDRNQFGALSPNKDEASLSEFIQGNANLIAQLRDTGNVEAELLPVLIDLKMRGASDEKLQEIVDNLREANALPKDLTFDIEVFTNFVNVDSDSDLRDVAELAELRAKEIDQLALATPPVGAERMRGWWDVINMPTALLEEGLGFIGDDAIQGQRENRNTVREDLRSVSELAATRFQAGVNASGAVGVGQMAAAAQELDVANGVSSGTGVNPLAEFLKQLDPDGELGLADDFVAGTTSSFEAMAMAIEKAGGQRLGDIVTAAEDLGIAGDRSEQIITVLKQLGSGELSMRTFADATEDLSERFLLLSMAGDRYYSILATQGAEAAQSFAMQQYELQKVNIPLEHQSKLWEQIWRQVQGTPEEFEALGQAAREGIVAEMERLMAMGRQGFDFSISGLNVADQIRALGELRRSAQEVFGRFSPQAESIRQEQHKLFYDLGQTIIGFEQQRRQILQQQEDAAEDAAISFSRQMRNIRRSQERALRDYRRGLMTALDPGDRFAGFRNRTLPTEVLIRNLELQNQRFQGLTRDLGRLRTMGLSEAVIQTLDLTNPENIMQVTKILGDSVQDPRFIGALNNAVSGRVDIVEAFTSDLRNAPDLMQSFNDQVADATQSYKDQLSDMQRDNARQLSRMGRDFDAFSITIEDAISGLGGVGNVYLDGIISTFVGLSDMLGLPIDTGVLGGFINNPEISRIVRLLGMNPVNESPLDDDRGANPGYSPGQTPLGGLEYPTFGPPPPIEDPQVAPSEYAGDWKDQLRAPTFYPTSMPSSSQTYETNYNYTGDITVQAQDPAEFQRELERKQQQQRLSGYLGAV